MVKMENNEIQNIKSDFERIKHLKRLKDNGLLDTEK